MPALPDNPRVFLSYARSDGELAAQRLRERLEDEHPEISLWQDRVRMQGGGRLVETAHRSARNG